MLAGVERSRSGAGARHANVIPSNPVRVDRRLETIFAAVWAERGLGQAPSPGGPACGDEVLERLGELLAAAHQAWPDLGLDEPALVRFVAERASRAADLDVARAGDLALASECARGSAKALAIVEALIRREIAPSVRRLKLGEADVNDALQRTTTDLFVASPLRPPGIARYDGRGELTGWLRVAAVRSGLKVLRGGRREASLEEEQLGARIAGARGDEPDLAYMKSLYRPAFEAAFRDALASLPARDRTLLKQSLLDGLSIDALAGLYKVHRATAARWVARAREELVESTRKLFQAQVRASPEECESLLRALQSHLDVTLRELAREA
jgi:RNA polymerase sigma-70 factor (ECF subfamily)